MSDAATKPEPAWLKPSTPPPALGKSPQPAPVLAPRPLSPHQPKRKSRPVEQRQPTPAQLRVTAWEDQLLIDTIPTIGFYAERYYGPIIGPTCLLIIRSLAGRLQTDAEGFDVVTEELATSIGCSSRSGANSQFWKALRRGARFGLLRQIDDRLLVRTELSPLPASLIQRLPVHLRREHRLWRPIVDLEPQELFSGTIPEQPLAPLSILRQAALGRCTPEELLSLDRARLLR